jgi:predicted dehydrogenase
MVEAARKYNRVVQVGTQSRSAGHMPAIRDLVNSGQLAQITAVRIWDYSLSPPEGIGDPPDTPEPAANSLAGVPRGRAFGFAQTGTFRDAETARQPFVQA